MRNLIPLAVITPLLACSPVTDEIAFEDAETPGAAFVGGTTYVCDTGEAIRTQSRGASIVIALDNGNALTLPRVSGFGAGTTYAADGWVWVVRGESAILTQQGGQSNCDVASQEEYDAAFERRQALPPGPPVAGFNPNA